MIIKNSNITVFEDFGILSSALNRIIVYTLFNYYEDVLKYIKYMKKYRSETIVTFNEVIPFEIPDFLLIWNEKINKSLYIIN